MNKADRRISVVRDHYDLCRLVLNKKTFSGVTSFKSKSVKSFRLFESFWRWSLQNVFSNYVNISRKAESMIKTIYYQI